MKECDILGVKTYSAPSYIFSGVKTTDVKRSQNVEAKAEVEAGHR